MKTKNIIFAILCSFIYSAIVSFAYEDSNPGISEVTIKGMTFNPPVITVAVNATVTWTNKDGTAHTVTSDAGLFDSGNISDNATFSHKFTTAGTYTYHCSIYPDMTGNVVVQESAAKSNY